MNISYLRIICLCWLLCRCMILPAQNLDSLYRCLDREIVKFPQYVAQHDQEVADLQARLNMATDDGSRYDLNFQLYEKYYPFKNDSAVFYLRECIDLAKRMNQPEKVDLCSSLMALRCSNTGMYDEALNILSEVKDHSGRITGRVRMCITNWLIIPTWKTCRRNTVSRRGITRT